MKRPLLLISLSLAFLLQPCLATVSITKERSDSLLTHYLQRHHIQITDSNHVQLLTNGHEKFDNLFEDIRHARHYIHIEYFNFRNDSIANMLFDLLKEKVKEGVKVRAMFDGFGNKSNNRPLKEKHLRILREAGIDIVCFDPFHFPYINHAFHRDHRKIVIIDGRVGYTGGMNVADYYINGLPGIGPWKDMHLRLEGKAVYDLHQVLIKMWEDETKRFIPQEERICYAPDSVYKIPGNELVHLGIVNRIPKDKELKKLLRRSFVETINEAHDSLALISPYFTPTHQVRNALKKAAERGLKLKIMISSKSDISITPNAALYVAYQLMKRGAEVYLFNEGFHHSKIMTIDGTHCTVGSANLNSRSLRYDYEVNTFIFDRKTTLQVDSVFQAACKGSTYLTPQVWKHYSVWKHIGCWLANLLTPFL